jgi:hypothetical protein
LEGLASGEKKDGGLKEKFEEGRKRFGDWGFDL